MELEKPPSNKHSTHSSQHKRIIQALKTLMSQLADGLKTVSYDSKSDYRHFFLPADISQTSIVLSFISAATMLFAISDYLFFGFSNEFFGLLALRLGLLFYTILQIRYIYHDTNFRNYDNSTFLYLLVSVFSVLIVNLTRPENFLPHVIVVEAAVFIFYLVIPIRFIYQAVPSLAFSTGEILIILFKVGPLNSSGTFTAVLSILFANIIAFLSSLQLHSYRWWIFQNVLERKETERLVAIGQTAGMIGHDIRNPLQAIVSELYLAKETIADTTNPVDKAQALESIDFIEEQADYISKIVSDLQDYAKPLKPEYNNVNFIKLIASIFQTVKVPEQILLNLDVNELPTVYTDQILLRRALTNLINNAIQAMPQGGKLSLTAAKKENKAFIEISDTGMGIPEEIKPKLFTPLFTTKAKGQGLGLVVVKRFIEALGGSITFESQTGKGTTFIIELPLENE